MIDQSHNLKPKIEEMIQTALAAQELFTKAAMVDHGTLNLHQSDCSLVDAEECLKTAFYTDVRPLLIEWRRSRGLPDDPIAAFRESGYLQRISKDRADRNTATASSYA
jgi:L-rhamnose isomerase/sugar isomerase